MMPVQRYVVWFVWAAVLCWTSTSAWAQSARDQLNASFTKGEELRSQGKAGEAIPHLENALRLAPTVLGASSQDTATIQLGLANAYRDMARYAQAEPLYQSSIQIRESKYGPNHVEVANVVNSLANLYLYQGKYQQALAMYQRCLRIKEVQLGPNHLEVAKTLSNQAIVHEKLGQLAQAEPLYERSLRIKEAQPVKDEVSIAATLFSMGNLYFISARYAQAEVAHKRSLQIKEAKLGPNHPDVALGLNALAALYENQGLDLQAESHYQRSLQIQEARLGKDHPEVASSLHGLGMIAMRLGQHSRAEPLLRRSLQIRESRLGADHPEVAASQDTLANLYRITGRTSEAEPLYQRSLRIRETKLGANHPAVAASLSNQGLLYIGLSRMDEAQPLLERSLRILEGALGKDHPTVAMNVHYLGIVYWARGQNDLAEVMYRRALQTRQSQLSADHPEVALTLHNLALVHAAQERWSDAASVADRSRRMVRKYEAQILPGLSEGDQLSFLENIDANRLHAVLSLGVKRKSDPAIVAQSATWMLNAKAVAQQVLVERAFQVRDNKTPETANLRQQLSDVRKRLAGWIAATDKPGQAAERQRQMESLKGQELDLARRLAQASGRARRDEPWVELNEVRQAVPDDAMLIDIMRVDVRNFRGPEKNPGPHYIAWLIPSTNQGNPEIVNLGEAAPIEAAVQKIRQELMAADQTIRTSGEAEAEKTLRSALQTLSDLVLKPLAPLIKSKQRWIVSPDGALWLVPWEALLWDDGYVVEKHRLSYLVSGRDVIPAPPVSTKTNAPMVMANPDFDLGVAEARAEARRILTDPQLQSQLRSPARSLRIGAVQRLPGTAEEAKAITPNLERFARAKPLVYTDKYAQEGVFKVFARPRVAVLSTHGFFQEDQAPAAVDQTALGLGEQRPARTTDGQPLENPLLRCGLLLAGVNRRSEATDPSQDDGVLTGLEIVSADMRGTELVVLSACETGLGQVRNGEGVAGLRQAFQLAGAQNVVATLWQVNDAETARLMNDFFINLAEGQPKAVALRNAQLKRMQARRENFGAAHPFFWAPFTMTGM